MIAKILLGTGVLIGGLLLFATTRPDSFRVERSIVVQAPPEAVYPLIADFHQWGRWSPWERLDPQMERIFAGTESGAGATYAWSGNSKAGAGRMEITDAAAPSRVQIQLDFTKPFASSNQTVFALRPEAGGTRVVWTMTGPMLYVSKVMSIFMDMDDMIGGDFERGLASIKSAAES